jgi:hypothetical protein
MCTPSKSPGPNQSLVTAAQQGLVAKCAKRWLSTLDDEGLLRQGLYPSVATIVEQSFIAKALWKRRLGDQRLDKQALI